MRGAAQTVADLSLPGTVELAFARGAAAHALADPGRRRPRARAAGRRRCLVCRRPARPPARPGAARRRVRRPGTVRARVRCRAVRGRAGRGRSRGIARVRRGRRGTGQRRAVRAATAARRRAGGSAWGPGTVSRPAQSRLRPGIRVAGGRRVRLRPGRGVGPLPAAAADPQLPGGPRRPGPRGRRWRVHRLGVAPGPAPAQGRARPPPSGWRPARSAWWCQWSAGRSAPRAGRTRSTCSPATWPGCSAGRCAGPRTGPRRWPPRPAAAASSSRSGWPPPRTGNCSPTSWTCTPASAPTRTSAPPSPARPARWPPALTGPRGFTRGSVRC